MQDLVVLLRSAVSRLSSTLQEHIETGLVENTQLKEELMGWVRMQGLGRKENEIYLVAKQATYNLLLKLMLYEMLLQRFSLTKIEGGNAANIDKLFEFALRRTAFDAFEASFLDRIIRVCDGELMAGLSNIAYLTERVERDRVDLIGRVYEDIMPSEERRKLGQFYTPRDVSVFMTTWAIRHPTDRVLDPACGSGTFLIDSFYRLGELGCPSTEAAYRLNGIDINPLAALMTTVSLIARSPYSHPHICVSDFLTSSLSMNKFQAIICNPPYSRHHELSSQYKELIAKKADAESKERISRLASVYVHFLIHSVQFAAEGGRLAFITPSEFLDVDYGTELKAYLLSNLTLNAIILYPQDQLLFPNVLTTACITLAENSKPNSAHQVSFVRLKAPLDPEKLLEVIKTVESGEFLWGQVEKVPQSELKSGDKWSYHRIPKGSTARLIPLGGIAQSHRGVATGANDFFTLNEDEIQRYEISREFLKPIITNAKDIPFYDFTYRDFQKLVESGGKVWLLDCNKPKEELREHKGLLEYLEIGKKRGLDKTYLNRKRKIWYFQERKKIGPIIFTYMSRKRPRFVYNEFGALTLNSLHAIYPVDAISQDKLKLKALLCYLNSGLGRKLIRMAGRIYGDGLLKVEPRELNNLPVLDPQKLSTQEILLLANLFDELTVSARMKREDEVRKSIDVQVERITIPR